MPITSNADTTASDVAPAPGPVGPVGTPGASQEPAITNPSALSSLGAWGGFCEALAHDLPASLAKSRRLTNHAALVLSRRNPAKK